jgi:tetratricopeptide (TPR) repeat protein
MSPPSEGIVGRMSRAFLSILALLLAGCDDSPRNGAPSLDIEDPEFKQGQIFQKQGDPRRALESFLKVIDSRKNAAESHLEAGRMYLDLDDPLPAIYHFNQYIRLKPGSQQTAIVKQMVRTAEKQFMKKLPGQPLEPDAAGSVDLNARMRALQSEEGTFGIHPTAAQRPGARRRPARHAAQGGSGQDLHRRRRRQSHAHLLQGLRERRTRQRHHAGQRRQGAEPPGSQARDGADHPRVSHADHPHPRG